MRRDLKRKLADRLGTVRRPKRGDHWHDEGRDYVFDGDKWIPLDQYLFEGGQGRSSRDVSDAAWITFMVVLIGVASLVGWILAGLI